VGRREPADGAEAATRAVSEQQQVRPVAALAEQVPLHHVEVEAAVPVGVEELRGPARSQGPAPGPDQAVAAPQEQLDPGVRDPRPSRSTSASGALLEFAAGRPSAARASS